MASSMAKNLMRDNVPLSRFGVLAAQLESIVASAAQKSPDPLLCFDLLSDLISAIDEETKVIQLSSHFPLRSTLSQIFDAPEFRYFICHLSLDNLSL